jgi:hypothetical protein
MVTQSGSLMRTLPPLANPVARATTRPRRVTVTRAARTRDVTASLSVHFTARNATNGSAGPPFWVFARQLEPM